MSLFEQCKQIYNIIKENDEFKYDDSEIITVDIFTRFPYSLKIFKIPIFDNIFCSLYGGKGIQFEKGKYTLINEGEQFCIHNKIIIPKRTKKLLFLNNYWDISNAILYNDMLNILIESKLNEQLKDEKNNIKQIEDKFNNKLSSLEKQISFQYEQNNKQLELINQLLEKTKELKDNAQNERIDQQNNKQLELINQLLEKTKELKDNAQNERIDQQNELISKLMDEIYDLKNKN